MPLSRATSRAEKAAEARTSPSILDALPNDPDHILVVNNVGTDAGDVYKVNIRTFQADRLQRTEERVAGYLTDPDGNLRARLKNDTDGKGAYVAAEFRNTQSGNWEEHFRSYVNSRDVVEVIDFSEDPNVAFILSNVGKDKVIIYEHDIAARTKKENLIEHRFFRCQRRDHQPVPSAMALGTDRTAGTTTTQPRVAMAPALLASKRR